VFITESIEDVVGPINSTSAADDITRLTHMILVGGIEYPHAVKLLGCTPPALRGKGTSQSAIGEGRWGSIADTEGRWKSDVPTALGFLARILANVWGTAAGGPIGTAHEFNLPQEVRIIVGTLTHPKAKEVFEDFFEQAAVQAKRLRQREGMDKVDWPMYVSSMAERKYSALLLELRAEEAADRKCDERADRGGGGDGGGSGAGDKRRTPGTPGTPGPVGEPGSRAKARAQRQAEYNNAKAAAGGAPLQLAGAAAVQPPKPAKPSGGGVSWVPDFKPDSITMFVDKINQMGAVDAFEYLCRQANPTGQAADMPCAFAALSKCSTQLTKPCRSCTRQAQMTTPTPVPAGAVARVKAACVAAIASRIN
jgi:hypothetical protein